MVLQSNLAVEIAEGVVISIVGLDCFRGLKCEEIHGFHSGPRDLLSHHQTNFLDLSD